jgi:hypothetical protein
MGIESGTARTARRLKARARCRIWPGLRRACGTCAVAAIAACGSGHPGTAGSASMPAPPPASGGESTPAITGGHIVSEVTIDDNVYYADGLLTPDGRLRASVAAWSGAPTLFQIVGELTGSGGQLSGGALIVGENCATETPPRFCDQPAAALVTFGTAEGATGEIQVAVAGGEETWSWRTEYWGGRPGFDSLSATAQGIYQLGGAGFGGAALTVDGEGRLFFQSPMTGCTGNGTLTPYPEFAIDVYDVALTLEGCTGQYAKLNGAFQGLSTLESVQPWDYGAPLANRFWLSTTPEAASPMGLTFEADSAD